MIDELIPGRPYGVSSQNWAYLEPFLEADHARVIRSIASDRSTHRV